MPEGQLTCVTYADQPHVLIEKAIDPKTHKFYRTYYGPLVGLTIKQIVVQRFESDPHQIMVSIDFTDGTNAAVMMDPEGNGPGHLDIQKL